MSVCEFGDVWASDWGSAQSDAQSNSFISEPLLSLVQTLYSAPNNLSKKP